MKESRTSSSGDFVSYVAVEVRSGKETHSVGGTIFGKTSPRLVMVDGFGLEVEPSGTILFIANKDVPGVIGTIGGVLAKHGINIANMANARKSAGGQALTVVSVDTEPDRKLIDELLGSPNIEGVHLIRMSG
jgi:D-3-phosphoglycerate dehydrogenase